MQDEKVARTQIAHVGLPAAKEFRLKKLLLYHFVSEVFHNLGFIFSATRPPVLRLIISPSEPWSPTPPKVVTLLAPHFSPPL